MRLAPLDRMSRAAAAMFRCAQFVAIVFLMSSADVGAQNCVDPPPGMIAWWPGDGNAQDIIGGRNGMLVNGATFGSGMVGQAFSFDGNSWVEVADDPIWTLGTNDFTIDAWVRFNALSGRDPFVGHDDSGGEFNKWIFWYDTSGHDKQNGVPALRLHTNSPHPVPLPFPHDPVVAPWQPATGRWYHVAVTRSGSSYALYIDGAQVATDTSAYPIGDPSVPLTIGAAEGYRLNGFVDELELFDRALAPGEITALYDAGSAGKCKGPVEQCDDEIDNDGDGLVDREDPNCQICGDGILDPGEGCDDGNVLNGDGCDAHCMLSTCGDGVVDQGEECDDGNQLECDPVHPQRPLDECNNTCRGLICKDPARIKLGPELDLLKFHGRLVPIDGGTIDFSRVGISLTTRSKIVFAATLPAGFIAAQPGGAFQYKRSAAKFDGGVLSLKATPRKGVYNVSIVAYGKLRNAAEDMVTRVSVGDREWTLQGRWRRTSRGWTWQESQ